MFGRDIDQVATIRVIQYSHYRRNLLIPHSSRNGEIQRVGNHSRGWKRAIIVRLVVKTTPGDRWSVEREMRARIQDALKREGITLPSMNTIVFDGPNGAEVRKTTGVDGKQEEQRRTDAGEPPAEKS